MNSTINSSAAFIPVDYEKDFSHPDGALYVKTSELLVDTINEIMEVFAHEGAQNVATKDEHPEGHISFASRYGVAPFTMDPVRGTTLVWPDHCVVATWWAEFVDGLKINLFNKIITKWTEKDDQVDSYSGFAHTELHSYLQSQGITTLFIGGVATDWCVKETIIDALKLGYTVYIVTDAIKWVDESKTQEVLNELVALGAKLITSTEIKAMAQSK